MCLPAFEGPPGFRSVLRA